MFEKEIPNNDFLLAKLKHIDWRIRLLAFLEGFQCISEEEISSSHCCELGIWLDKEGIKKYQSLSEIHQLAELHSQLHNFSKKILLQKSESLFCEEYEQIRELSQKIIKLLENLDAKAQELIT